MSQKHNRRGQKSVPNVIGLSAYFHDAACCLLQDGCITAAAQEERFSRRKHDRSLPRMAFEFCLRQGQLTLADVDAVAYYENPVKKLHRQLSQSGGSLSKDRCMQLWRRSRLPIDEIRETLGYEGEVTIVDHHLSHAASTFYMSGFEEAAILTADGVGEWATTSYAMGCGNAIEIFEEVDFPNSLGLLYSTITGYLGFAVNDGEYKVMGLAAYGNPRYADKLRTLVRSAPSGQFVLDDGCFDFTRQDRMYSDSLVDFIGHPPRRAGEPIHAFHQDLARSVQCVLEELLLEKVRFLHSRVPVENLCLAGGVALNCTANGKIVRNGPFKRVFFQPAAGDAGGALGAAAFVHAQHAKSHSQKMEHAFWGPCYSDADVMQIFDSAGISGADFRLREPELLQEVVAQLVDGKVVAWFQGRMEFGPRALGMRSILADPRNPAMRDRINLLIKKRESFRPFAPAVLEHRAHEYFDLDHPSPFMLETCQVKSPAALPAVTHSDGSARVQTVNAQHNPRFARLLELFDQTTGCPILLNTSFNLSDEPIVCTPSDALTSFARSDLDTLVMENFVLRRTSVPPSLISACRSARQVPPQADRVYTFW
jgi:carbamoyltransferase